MMRGLLVCILGTYGHAALLTLLGYPACPGAIMAGSKDGSLALMCGVCSSAPVPCICAIALSCAVGVTHCTVVLLLCAAQGDLACYAKLTAAHPASLC